MKTKLTMQMPETLADARDVEITGVVTLPNSEYQTIITNGQFPSRYLDRLNKYTQAVTPRGSSMISEYKALLVLGEDSENGIAVCGKNYVSYAASFPCAKEWLNSRIEKMANFACRLRDLPDGSLHLVPLEMLGDYADMKVTKDNGTGELLLKELESRAEISQIIMMEDCFEIDYYLGHVQDCVGPGERIMTLMGLIGCNLEDVHLCHCEEDHELATVSELNPGTLTEQGKEDWADVLDARVERIYNGSYGTQIGLSGVDAERLSDFSYMLAGYVSSKDYDRWVNNDERNTADIHAAEQYFSDRMQKIDGIDMGKTQEWLDHAWDMSEAYASQKGIYRATGYQRIIKEFADAFAAVNRDFMTGASDIFNYKAAYRPDQLYKIADWICEGGSAEDAYEIWGKPGSPEITDPSDPDEDESQGMTMQ